MKRYPKYNWKQDLRRKVSPKQAFLIRRRYILGISLGTLARNYGLPESTVKYWAYGKSEKERIRDCYWRQRREGTLPYKSQDRIRRCWQRKLILCPEIKDWRREYNRIWMGENKEKVREYMREWRKKHPEYFKNYFNCRKEK